MTTQTKRRINLTSIVIIVLVVLAFLFWPSSAAHSNAPKPCSFGASPCIEILNEQGGVVAKVNDFRFGPQGCVYYRNSENVTYSEHCGGYTMKWIGPALPSHTGAAKI